MSLSFGPCRKRLRAPRGSCMPRPAECLRTNLTGLVPVSGRLERYGVTVASLRLCRKLAHFAWRSFADLCP
ncbi:protein of unknown function [Paraburkholderia kururiensis]